MQEWGYELNRIAEHDIGYLIRSWCFVWVQLVDAMTDLVQRRQVEGEWSGEGAIVAREARDLCWSGCEKGVNKELALAFCSGELSGDSGVGQRGSPEGADGQGAAVMEARSGTLAGIPDVGLHNIFQPGFPVKCLRVPEGHGVCITHAVASSLGCRPAMHASC